MKWSIPCTTSYCRGVPLFREYLTDDENTNKIRPQIRMMGQSTAQRSTLSLNHGAYYLDTTQNCTSLGGCPKCLTVDPKNPQRCQTYDGNPYNPSTFLGGHTYYVYFLYATVKTKQHYDIYVGPGSSLSELNVTAVTMDPNTYSTPNATNGGFINAKYPAGPNGEILSVDVDLSGQASTFTNSKGLFCNPKSYCAVDTHTGACGCKLGSNCVQPSDCAWGPNDMDCPVDPKNPNVMHCFGLSFTMPAIFVAPNLPIVPDDSLFSLFTKGNYTTSRPEMWGSPTEKPSAPTTCANIRRSK
jgi:cell migration-inducing and hyaluronan-binding protein